MKSPELAQLLKRLHIRKVNGKLRAVDVANIFLLLAWLEGKDITTIKLQKLVYITYGFYAALMNAPLFDDRIVARSYGPVIPSLYKKIVRFGAGNVTELL